MALSMVTRPHLLENAMNKFNNAKLAVVQAMWYRNVRSGGLRVGQAMAGSTQEPHAEIPPSPPTILGPPRR